MQLRFVVPAGEMAFYLQVYTMAPNLLGTSALFLAEATTQESLKSQSCVQPQQYTKRPVSIGEKPKYRWQIVWRNVIAFVYLHTFAFYGLYLTIFVCTWKTFFWGKWLWFFTKVLNKCKNEVKHCNGDELLPMWLHHSEERKWFCKEQFINTSFTPTIVHTMRLYLPVLQSYIYLLW